MHFSPLFQCLVTQSHTVKFTMHAANIHVCEVKLLCILTSMGNYSLGKTLGLHPLENIE